MTARERAAYVGHAAAVQAARDAEREERERGVTDSMRATVALHTIEYDVRDITACNKALPLSPRNRRRLRRATGRARVLVPRLEHEADRAIWSSWLTHCDQVLSR